MLFLANFLSLKRKWTVVLPFYGILGLKNEKIHNFAKYSILIATKFALVQGRNEIIFI